MIASDIIDLQISKAFGFLWSPKIKSLVNAELEEGRFAPGYELAVTKEELPSNAASELLEVLLAEYPDYRIDEPNLISLVHDSLPQSQIAEVAWIVTINGSIVITDSLRVGRISGGVMLWVTPRISFDGIDLIKVEDGTVYGNAYWIGSFKPDAPFEIDFESGTVKEGQIVEE